LKSSPSNINNPGWHSPLSSLVNKKTQPAYIKKLTEAGVKTIHDLIYIFPLRVQKAPKLSPFSEIKEGELFKGAGKVIGVQSRPLYGRKGRGRVPLFQISVTVKDLLSESYLQLKWFNAYPNQVKMLNSKEFIQFQGEAKEYGGIQITNPKVSDYNSEELEMDEVLREYPTVNGVAGKYTKGLIDFIPSSLWEQLPDSLTGKIQLNRAFRIIHGIEFTSVDIKEEAEQRIIYEEFLTEQLKLKARRRGVKKNNAPIISLSEEQNQNIFSSFPYELTSDQKISVEKIQEDLQSGKPMMRMLQGDVGCGKTTVAFYACLATMKSSFQSAFMAPTEALAIQHYKNFQNLFPNIKGFEVLLGSTPAKRKKEIYASLKSGEIKIIFGTHSLFQKAVEFENLALAIIDEQHKFGVEQRLSLMKKGSGVHCLIMSATPIPRTLSISQFGDLDISIIKSMPSGRKKIQTRIIEKNLLIKYYSFVKTRLSLGEQAYIVAPAIEESETLDISNVEEIFERYKEVFPGINIACLHGRMKPEEKEIVLNKFVTGDIQLLISTSVIEVGIDVKNATIMSIHNPERFGLSSIHQLRGRVGRGGKPGFCFLTLEKSIAPESMERLKVLESTLDGFKISEYDLEMRGHGDLFGNEQSGTIQSRKLANIVKHRDILLQVCHDLDEISVHSPSQYNLLLSPYEADLKVSSTI
jgi:ATP-dependent DNA helicase RecG